MQVKFMPATGQTLFIIGQDLGAVGGLPGYTDGYVDHVTPFPGGVTTYTNLHALDGLTTVANWGSGDVSAQRLVDSPAYANSVLVIGLWLGNANLTPIARGDLDRNIDRLAIWIKDQNRPVFLRIGYEFDGEWNAYQPADYITAFQRIVDRFRALEVTNVATVWQSATWYDGTFQGHDWLEWYPGDDYVDWFGMSYFIAHPPTFNAWLDLARSHDKPVMIAESTPKGHDLATEAGGEVWNAWFQGFFDFIHENHDVIKAVAYINVHWEAQPMWQGQDWGDSRVQVNSFLLEQWQREMKSDFWLQTSPELFQILNDDT
ncbi:MAG: 1,4-beta-xylanase [Anaerolineae bacterium]|nr:1,4-beta-xylanase [Anaerolineae bacterium]